MLNSIYFVIDLEPWKPLTLSELHEQRKRTRDEKEPLASAKMRIGESKQRPVAVVKPFQHEPETPAWPSQGLPSNQLQAVEMGLLTY